MPLHTSYRPKKLKSIIGNDAIKDSLKGLLKRKEIPPAFLFSGPSGCGKTTFARVLKNELKVSDTDFIELNAADDRGIEAVRALREGMKLAPLIGDKKVILLDEAHMITATAQEALLKLLEEPPSHVHIVLCTTNPEKLKTTLKRRCHHYAVTPLKKAEIEALLKKVLKKEKIDPDKFPKKILEKIDDLADGSAGQALKLLDQVIDMTDEKAALHTLQSAGMSMAEVIDLCRVIANFTMNEQTKWGRIHKFLIDFTGDAESARFAILAYLSKVLLDRPNEAVAETMNCFTESFFYTGKAGLTLACYYAVFGVK